jgi:hypothetical protein
MWLGAVVAAAPPDAVAAIEQVLNASNRAGVDIFSRV